MFGTTMNSTNLLYKDIYHHQAFFSIPLPSSLPKTIQRKKIKPFFQLTIWFFDCIIVWWSAVSCFSYFRKENVNPLSGRNDIQALLLGVTLNFANFRQNPGIRVSREISKLATVIRKCLFLRKFQKGVIHESLFFKKSL